METLMVQKIIRAGSSMTITHNGGKLAGINRIEAQMVEGFPQMVATIDGGNLGPDRCFILGIGAAS